MIGIRLEFDRVTGGGGAHDRGSLHAQNAGMIQDLSDAAGFVVSGWDESFDDEDAETIWIDGYVATPASVNDVLEVADRWLQSDEIRDVRLGLGERVSDIVMQRFEDFVRAGSAWADVAYAAPDVGSPTSGPPASAAPSAPDRPRSIGAAPQPDPTAGVGTEPEPGAAHEAYGLLRAPAEVVARVGFTLDVGLSPEPAAGVAGPPLTLPPVAIEPYLIDVRISAPGFDFAEGESPLRHLPVNSTDPYPVIGIGLIPRPTRGRAVNRTVTAEYSIGGERLGDAIRSVRVLRSDSQRRRPTGERVEAGANVLAPTGEEKADLTITIRTLGYPSPTWTLDSPYTDVVPPSADTYTRPIGDPAAFLTRLIEQIDAAEGQDGVFDEVAGLAYAITRAIPDEVWRAIRAVAAHVGKPPTILLVSEDPYVPWELAAVDEQRPLVPESAAPPFLCAQARIGRWVQATGFVDGRERPSPNPPRSKDVGTLGVVWGNYSGTRWANLAHAEAEGTELEQRYGATRIEPTRPAMTSLLRNDPPADLLHFAVHGRYSPGRVETGIILTDGRNLAANTIAGKNLARQPVVFLNACQLAGGERELGAYSGVAAAFVEAGASAVVAPLWKVDDEHARTVAIEFYRQAAAGEPLSEVLRRARQAFLADHGITSSTWMAYQLFGHPAFVIRGLTPT